MKIAIDAGHGKNTPGKRTPDGIREWELNSKVAKYLAEYLKGYATTFRTDDTTGKTDVKLTTRRNKAINNKADLLVSIHHNANTGKWNSATGVEVYRHILFSHKKAKSLTTKLAKAISKETGLLNRGVKKALFTVIASSKIPCILCEGGFMDGKTDSHYIRTIEGQKAYAKAVADTIINYYGLKKTTTASTKKTYNGTFPKLPTRGYFYYDTKNKKVVDKGTQVKNLQKFLNWAIGTKLAIDGSLGQASHKAILKFQKTYGLEKDGFFRFKMFRKSENNKEIKYKM